jgi:HEAT repeat protein
MSSAHVKMPFACGLFRPVIVLPVEADEWTAERRTAVLLHELAHVRRRDLIGHALGRVVCAFYWFHPLVWTAARRLRIESERACDDFALNCGARASDYAEHLLDIVTTIRQHTTPAVAMAMAQPREFEGRMLAILDPELSRRAPSRRQSALYISGLAMLALVVGAAAPASPAAQPSAPSTLADGGVVAAPPAGDSVKSLALPLTTPSSAATRAAARPARPEAGNQTERESSTMNVVTQTNVQQNTSTSTSAVINSLLSEHGLSQAQQGKSDERSRILINVLKTDKEASVRRIAAWGLNEYANEKAVTEALAEALRRDSDAEVREMAAWALSEGAEDRVAVDALTAAIKQDADEKVRATAAWSLGQSEDKSAAEVLLTIVNDKNPKVRSVAIWGIGNVEPDRAPQAVIAALNDPDTHVRRLAAWALYQIEDSAAAPALEAALNKETDKDLRRAYLMALSTMGERSASVISRLLESDDREIRTMAVKALAGGGHSMGPWPWPWPQPRPYP